MRTLLVWCPDWPVTAAEIVDGVPAAGPVAVLRENRVIACSEAARQDGVRRGLRRREAQSRSPRLVVVDHDPGRDARAFEPVVAAVEEVAVGVEVIRPGACALAARGPARYFGGEEAAAERIVEQIAEVCAVESQVGIADGVFAAGLAARDGRVLGDGETVAFLAGMPISALERPELVDLLKRLGVKTLGDFAALPAGDVLTRFGFDGALAHRLASGRDHRPLAVRQPPLDLDVADTYDEPLDRVDVAAFAGKNLAERLHDRLAAHGLACTRLGIEAVTADGQELHRVWRHDGTLTAAAIAERVRWQLDGWLTGARRGAPARPTAGLVRLRLIPDGVLVHLGLQPGLWGDAGADRERAHRAFSRVQGLLGPESLVTPIPTGGRSADDQIRLIPWGDERDPHHPTAPHHDPIPDLTTVPLQTYAEATPLPTLSLVPALPEDPETENPETQDPGVPAPPLPGVRPEPADADAEVIELSSRRPAPAAEQEGLATVSHLPVSSRTGKRGGKEEGPAQGSPAPIRGLEEAAPAAGPAGTGAGRDSAESASPAVEPAPAGAGRDSAESVSPPAGLTVVTVPPGRRKGGQAAAPVVGLPPWPGRLPKPSPAVVPLHPLAAVVLDESGTPVGVSARLELTGEPAALVVERGGPIEISGWAGPWPVDERWWAAGESRRRARFQVALTDGRALLLALAGGHWAVEAIYD
ncbi:DNA polymerase Y family protein [Paractinoplanes durhamensis]|uniref:DNA polymerase Y family protein n=1 Tax=Paractinoplanes durhamensis TaxID=113563 RepID=UPI0027DE31D7|nr:DNA polymerase Y family protein [Actinoplanes durhamensis]